MLFMPASLFSSRFPAAALTVSDSFRTFDVSAPRTHKAVNQLSHAPCVVLAAARLTALPVSAVLRASRSAFN
jgi:hypothetical protein